MKIKCMEPGCDQYVIYKPQIVLKAMFTFGKPTEPTDKIVYLRCPKGHEHAYTITQPD